MIKKIISNNYSQYIDFLKKIAVMPSVFTNPKDIKKTIEFCKKIFEKNLIDYNIYFDKEKNLIALPNKINPKENIVYLSAHIDTVDANPEEWDKPFHPWKVYENKNEIIARGVSDCKAGVAYQLFISYLIKQKLIKLNNTIFTITFKEEGVGNKTSKEIAKQLGKKLPISKKSTYLIVLENNVLISPKPTLCIYTSERGNYIIKITDYISNLQKHFLKLSYWNPISIIPKKINPDINWKIKTQTGGHSCSTDRDDNLLTNIILNANDNTVIKAGDKKSFAMVPAKIYTSTIKKPIKHSLVLSNRSFDSLNKVYKQLKGIKYKAIKDFSISPGLNIDKKYSKNKISKIISQCEKNSEIKIKHTYNVGRTDASIIYLSLQKKNNFYPIVMGPGSRSQKNISPQRLTHGKNETFDKKSGEKAIIFISEVLKQLGRIE